MDGSSSRTSQCARMSSATQHERPEAGACGFPGAIRSNSRWVADRPRACSSLRTRGGRALDLGSRSRFGASMLHVAGAHVVAPDLAAVAPRASAPRADAGRDRARHADLLLSPSRHQTRERVASGLPADRVIRFAFVGSLIWQKRRHVLLTAFDEVQLRAWISVAGSPGCNTHYVSLVEPLLRHSRMHVVGASHDGVHSYLPASRSMRHSWPSPRSSDRGWAAARSWSRQVKACSTTPTILSCCASSSSACTATRVSHADSPLRHDL